jgi:hypothetical protein
MNIPNFDKLNEFFNYACREDQYAVRFCADAWRVAHLWDDLIDGDLVTKEEVNAGMVSATTSMMSNPFVAAHLGQCCSMLALVNANWQTANEMESGKRDLGKAFILRAQLYNVPVLCAFLLGGQEWANHVSSVSWAAYGEKFADYKREVERA